MADRPITMPLCTLYLLSLTTPLPTFLSALSSTPTTPLVTSRVIRWIIKPTKLSLDPLLTQSPPWDILLILPGTTGLPSTLQSHIRAEWRITAGIPKSIVEGFRERNERLLHPREGDVPALTGALEEPRIASSAQNLELTDELRAWIASPACPRGAVSMLNLLSFLPDKKESYLKYGAAFASSIGSRRGGVAKIVGKVVECSDGCREWDEVALAHYPSASHFADMAGSEDYQEVNQRFRVPSLRDTFILMTSEVSLGREREGARL